MSGDPDRGELRDDGALDLAKRTGGFFVFVALVAFFHLVVGLPWLGGLTWP